MNADTREEMVEQACEVMHDAYEAAALAEGWETQARSRKSWANVPEANKATMRAAVRALLASPAMNAVVAERVAALAEDDEPLATVVARAVFASARWDDVVGQVWQETAAALAERSQS